METVKDVLEHCRWLRKTRASEYTIWKGMRQRCMSKTCPAFRYYGGRGITICTRWGMFENFFMDMGPRPTRKHSIERIDNDGPYSPENCKWIERNQQSLNRRGVGLSVHVCGHKRTGRVCRICKNEQERKRWRSDPSYREQHKLKLRRLRRKWHGDS